MAQPGGPTWTHPSLPFPRSTAGLQRSGERQQGSPCPEECSPNAAGRQTTERKPYSELQGRGPFGHSVNKPLTQSQVPHLLVLGRVGLTKAPWVGRWGALRFPQQPGANAPLPLS